MVHRRSPCVIRGRRGLQVSGPLTNNFRLYTWPRVNEVCVPFCRVFFLCVETPLRFMCCLLVCYLIDVLMGDNWWGGGGGGGGGGAGETKQTTSVFMTVPVSDNKGITYFFYIFILYFKSIKWVRLWVFLDKLGYLHFLKCTWHLIV